MIQRAAFTLLFLWEGVYLLTTIAFDSFGDVGSPTVLLLHGILGSRRNWRHFMRQIASNNSHWHFVVVDLRHHGDSGQPDEGAQTLADCAQDLVELMAQLNCSPKQIWGHSFGGKVALVLAELLLKKPEHVWVLDALPGSIATDQLGGSEQSVVSVIQHLLKVPLPIVSRNDLKTFLLELGFSSTLAGWMTTNLKPAPDGVDGFVWRFNLTAIPFLLRSYASMDCWPIIERCQATTAFHFLRAERSDRWTQRVLAEFEKRSQFSNLYLHTLPNAGHWVHVDNPAGLTELLQKSL